MKMEIYEGIITKRDDPKNQGRYYVYIPELMFNDLSDNPPIDNKYSGIWCYNLLSNFSRYTETDYREFKDTNSYGSYQPLRPGTHVLVGLAIDENDYSPAKQCGHILNIISYEIPPNNDRDDFFLVQTTDKQSWIYIDETNKNFAMSLHAQKTNVWGTDDYIHLSKDSGTVVEVHNDHILNFHHSGSYCYLDGTEITASIGQSFIRMTKDHISIKSDTVYIQGMSLVAIEGGKVQINDGVVVPDQAAVKQDIAKKSLDSIKAVDDADKSMHKKLKNGK